MAEVNLEEFLKTATHNDTSDIFIISGRPFSMKINGKLQGYGERLMPADTERVIRELYEMANHRSRHGKEENPLRQAFRKGRR